MEDSERVEESEEVRNAVDGVSADNAVPVGVEGGDVDAGTAEKVATAEADGTVEREAVPQAGAVAEAQVTGEDKGKDEIGATAAAGGDEEPEMVTDDDIEHRVKEAAEEWWSFASTSLGKVTSVANEVAGKGLGDVVQLGSRLYGVKEIVAEETTEMERAIQSSVDSNSDRVVPQELDIRREIDSIQNSFKGTLNVGFGMFSGLINSAASGIKSGMPYQWEEAAAHQRDAAANVPLGRFQRKVRELQANPDTYCQSPEDTEAFDRFRESLDLSSKDAQIKEVFTFNPEIKGLYDRTVPRLIEYDLFWSRYFYALQQLEHEEERRMALLQNTKATEQAEEEIGWDDDDEVGEAETTAESGAMNGAPTEKVGTTGTEIAPEASKVSNNAADESGIAPNPTGDGAAAPVTNDDDDDDEWE